MRLLLTNDDGIDSEGLHVLTRAMAGTGHEILVVAPNRDWSGSGAALGSIHADEHIEVTRVEIPELSGIEAMSVAGPPGMAVVAARLGAFGPPPDLVVSGINPGANTGRAILHSGTVGAALTGQNFGVSGLAVSIDWKEPLHWDTAASLAVDALARLLEAPPRTVLNLNVPSCPLDEVKGVRWARLAPFGAVRAAIGEARDGRLQFEFRATDESPDPDTDQGLVDRGYASLTTLVGIAEAWPPDEEIGATALEEHVVPGAPLHPVHRIPDASRSRSLRRPYLGDE